MGFEAFNAERSAEPRSIAERYIDWVAVEEALQGKLPVLTRPERREVFRLGLKREMAPYEIGRLLKMNGREISRVLGDLA